MSEMDPVRHRLIQGAGAGVQAWLEAVIGDAQREAPVEEGTLRGSGWVEVVVHEDTVVGACGFATVYAARQHEETTWIHPIGGKAKYLEDPFKTRLPDFAPTIERATRV